MGSPNTINLYFIIALKLVYSKVFTVNKSTNQRGMFYITLRPTNRFRWDYIFVTRRGSTGWATKEPPTAEGSHKRNKPLHLPIWPPISLCVSAQIHYICTPVLKKIERN